MADYGFSLGRINGQLEELANFTKSAADELYKLNAALRYVYVSEAGMAGEYGSRTYRIERATGAVAQLRMRRNPERQDMDAPDYWINYWEPLMMGKPGDKPAEGETK